MALRTLQKKAKGAGPGDSGTVVREVRSEEMIQMLLSILQELQGIRAQLNDITELES